MRKSTMLWLALAAFCGTALFHTSQKVHDEREQLEKLNTSIAKEEESLRVLNAEWGYLNQPERLEKLAKTYLKIAPLKGNQFTKIEDIPLRPEKPTEEKVAAAPVMEPEAKAAPVEKPVVAEKPVAEKSLKVEKPVAVVTATPVKIRKPAPVVAKPAAKPPATATAAKDNPDRSFTDVMKSLQAGAAQ